MRRVFLALLLILPVTAFGAQIILNPSFEGSGSCPTPPGYCTVPTAGPVANWTADPSFRWIPSSYQAASSGSWSIELLTGTTGIRQSLHGLTAGQSYTLYMDLWSDKGIVDGNRTVTINVAVGTSNENIVFSSSGVHGAPRTDHTWLTNVPFYFVASGSDIDLVMKGVSTYNGYGMMVDNLRLYAIPEPTLPILFGTLLLLVPFARRLRRQ